MFTWKQIKLYLRAAALVSAFGGGLWLALRFVPAPPTRIEMTAQGVLQKILSASELTTAIATVEAIVAPSQETEVLGIRTGETRLTYRLAGEVRAGVDLSKLTPDRISLDPLSVRLPAPQIFTVSVIKGETLSTQARGIYVDQDSVVRLRDAVEGAGRKELRRIACSSGLLDRAEEQAVNTIKSLFPEQEISVHFDERGACH